MFIFQICSFRESLMPGLRVNTGAFWMILEMKLSTTWRTVSPSKQHASSNKWKKKAKTWMMKSGRQHTATDLFLSEKLKEYKAFISSGIKWLTLAASLRISPKKTFCQPLSLMDFSLFGKPTFDIQTETLLFVS